jgi:hypothetical protein
VIRVIDKKVKGSFIDLLPEICFWGGVLEGVVEKIGEGRKGVMVAQERGWWGADSFWKHCLIPPFSRN